MWFVFGRRFIGDKSGTAAVELAIVLPVVVMLLAGGGQLAWMQHCNSSLRYALTTVSRQLRLDPTLSQSTLQTRVRAKLSGADPDVIVTLAVVDDATGKTATLTGHYEHSIVLPLFPSIPVNYNTSVVTPLAAY